jgi:hypothetical protein
MQDKVHESVVQNTVVECSRRRRWRRMSRRRWRRRREGGAE